MLFLVSHDLLGKVDLGTGRLFAECLCSMVYMFGKVWVMPYCSRRKERAQDGGSGGAPGIRKVTYSMF